MNIELETASAEACDLSRGFLQSGFWGRFKSEFGWTSLHFSLRRGSESCPLLVLERSIRRGFSFAYVPHGPDCDLSSRDTADFLASVARSLRPHLSPTCIFLRFDPPWHLVSGAAGDAEAKDGLAQGGGAEPLRPLVGAPLRRAAADVQPPDTVLLDLDADPESLLAAMKPKWRYNIKLAAKKGVVVEEAGAEALPEFYRLYRKTAERDRIALHPEHYYSRLFSLASSYGDGAARGPLVPDLRLWFARHEGEALAAIVTLFRGERAVYLYGASSDEKRNLMPAYALQWAAIQAAKAAGCREYDFFGIPPSDDPQHPMAGLYRFKTGFGGSIVHRAGSWDYPLRPLTYRVFRAAEAARQWWFKDFKKRRGARGPGAAERQRD